MKIGFNALLLVGLVVAAGPAAGASLSGQEGEGRRILLFTTFLTGGCRILSHVFGPAGGHSAYAATPSVDIEAFICGAALNAGSKQAAERRALEQCRAGLKRFKTSAVPLCEIAASK